MGKGGGEQIPAAFVMLPKRLTTGFLSARYPTSFMAGPWVTVTSFTRL